MEFAFAFMLNINNPIDTITKIGSNSTNVLWIIPAVLNIVDVERPNNTNKDPTMGVQHNICVNIPATNAVAVSDLCFFTLCSCKAYTIIDIDTAKRIDIIKNPIISKISPNNMEFKRIGVNMYPILIR